MIDEDKFVKCQKSLEILKRLRINTPEMIMSCFFPESEGDRTQNKIFLKANSMRVKNNVVIPNYRYTPLTTVEYMKFADEYAGGPLIVFKAPKSLPLVSGICKPEKYVNKVSLHGSPFFSTVWGDKELDPFPVGLKRTIQDLNTMLVLGGIELTGYELRFTYHVNPEGSLRNKVVIWGQNLEG